jgi:hypothetical protein
MRLLTVRSVLCLVPLLLLATAWPALANPLAGPLRDMAAAGDAGSAIILAQDRSGGGKPGSSSPKDQNRGSSSGGAPSGAAPAGDYSLLRGREIWITYNARGKPIADQVQARLESVGMVVLLDEEGDEHVDWDHDFDYEAKDADVVALVKQLVDDLYVMDLLISDARSIPNLQITPPPPGGVAPPAAEPLAADLQPIPAPPAPRGDFSSLAGREVWITYNDRGKNVAAQVLSRLQSVGMVVLLDHEGDEHVDWDHDFDYEAKDATMVALVKQLVDDLYPMDLLISDSRSIPNLQITPPP